MSATTNNRHGSAIIEMQGDREYVVTRKFDAPAELIFRAHSTAELVKRWWGAADTEWLVCEVDFRVSGSWRNVVRGWGMELGFHGTYLEIDRPHRLVITEFYEGGEGAPVAEGGDSGTVNTTTLVEDGNGVTTMTVRVRHALPEHRDAMIATGMEDGMQVSYDRLEDLLRNV